MKIVYQDIIDKGHGNCAQAAIASLFDMELSEVPNFKAEGADFWGDLIQFVFKSGYEFHGTLTNPYNSMLNSMKFYFERNKFPKNDFDRLKDCEGVGGYFFASVYSPKFFDPMSDRKTTHAVIINKEFEIVNPVNRGYEGIKKFPLWDIIGYNGIIDILMIDKK